MRGAGLRLGLELRAWANDLTPPQGVTGGGKRQRHPGIEGLGRTEDGPSV